MIKTNKMIQRGEALDVLARRLIEAAYDYWQEYQKEMAPAAVVWVDDDSGHFVLFTRGEYKPQIIAAACRVCRGERAMFEPFTSSEEEEKDEKNHQ